MEAAIDKRSSMGVIGNMQAYTQYQTRQRDSAMRRRIPAGWPAAGAGMAAGYQMAAQMGQAFSAGGAAGPPPVPQAAGYFIAVNGAQSGPLGMGDLSAKIAAGQLTRQTLVWKQGMAAWAAAESVAELAGLFAAAPPPVPKNDALRKSNAQMKCEIFILHFPMPDISRCALSK